MSHSGGSSPKQVIHGPRLTLHPSRTPIVMGILNVTPDSFSDGGESFELEAAVRHAHRLADDGAAIIDIGGESSRPGADGVTLDEELRRILPVAERLSRELSVPLSIDTRRATVARAALEAGCAMVNDITAGGDPDMPAVLLESGAPIVIMHMKGDPKSMQANPTYDDVVKEVVEFLRSRADFLKRSGIEGDKIVIDPGIGFGKRFRDNLELLGAIRTLREVGYPVLIGASRKSFLGELLDAGPGKRLSGSLAVAAWCHHAGTDIVRVHDVRETVELFRVLDAIDYPQEYGTDRGEKDR